MLKINQIKVPVNIELDKHIDVIRKKISKKLNISNSDIENVVILKKSIDARKDDINYVYSIACELSKNIRINTKWW